MRHGIWRMIMVEFLEYARFLLRKFYTKNVFLFYNILINNGKYYEKHLLIYIWYLNSKQWIDLAIDAIKLILRAIQQLIITNYVMTQIMIAKNEKISSLCVRRNRQRRRGVKWHLDLPCMVFIKSNKKQ